MLDLGVRMSHLSVLLSSAVFLAASLPASMEAATAASCAVVDIHEVGWSRLAEIKSTEGAAWWIELGGELVFCGSDLAIAKVAANYQLLASHEELDLDALEVARGFHQSELDHLGLEVIAEAAGVALVRGEGATIELGQRLLLPAVPDSVEIRQAANKTPRGRVVFAPEVQGLVDMVDGDRWFADVETLASYNRYTHNSGIDDARTWLVAQLQTLPGLQVTTSSFQVGDTTAYNVIATLTGRTRPEEWYIIGAHYDSISQTPQVAAPGAEDNGSGCAGVLEMARIFAANPPDATTLFICYSAEELGLLGSYDHVDDLIDASTLNNVQSMLDLDMIGFTSDSDLDCKLETDPFASFLFDVFEDAALQFTTLRLLTDLNACCSDHQPYLEAGVPALLTIEADWFQYQWYHTVNDLPEHLTIDMAREILKMNVAAMAQMIGAPDPPFFTDGFESGDTSAWSVAVP